MPKTHTLPRALGAFSLGLATAQLAAPSAVARLIGLKPGSTSTTVMRAVGARELAAGGALLTDRSHAPVWLWARVAGDLMDLALLGAALTDKHNQRGRVTAALATVGGVAAADLFSARQTAQAHEDEGPGGSQRLTKAITVRRSPDEVYRFWREFRNFPSFMSHLESVAVLDDRRSHWTAHGPAGRLVEWDAEIIEDRPNERIGWRSLPGATVANSGTVQFLAAPGGRGTEIHLEMEYQPPAAELGSLFARLFGQEPRQQVQADLRKLKQVLETGEVIRSSATLGGTHVMQRPAQPVEARS